MHAAYTPEIHASLFRHDEFRRRDVLRSLVTLTHLSLRLGRAFKCASFSANRLPPCPAELVKRQFLLLGLHT